MITKQKTETINGIKMEVLKQTIGDIQRDPELGKSTFSVTNKWTGANQNCSCVSGFCGGHQEVSHKHAFKLHADEPALLGGADKAANPAEHLLHAIAACMTTSMVAHAAIEGIHIEELESQVSGDIDLNGYLGLSDDTPKGYTNIRVKFKVKSDVEDIEQLKCLAEFSPVFSTITQGARVDVEVESK